MARRTNQFPRRSQSRPNRSWLGIFTAANVNVPAASKVLLATIVPSNTGVDETILRSVGRCFVQSDATATEQQIGALGLIRVTDRAVAAGIASIPDPITDGGDDWLLYVPIVQTNEVLDGTATQAVNGVGYDFDSKAKRILDGDGVAFALVVANAHATFAFDIALVFRVLGQIRGTR